jgi:hypothetical protein
MWTAAPSANGSEELLQATGADLAATSLRQALRQVEEDKPERPELAPKSRTTAA